MKLSLFNFLIFVLSLLESCGERERVEWHVWRVSWWSWCVLFDCAFCCWYGWGLWCCYIRCNNDFEPQALFVATKKIFSLSHFFTLSSLITQQKKKLSLVSIAKYTSHIWRQIAIPPSLSIQVTTLFSNTKWRQDKQLDIHVFLTTSIDFGLVHQVVNDC